MSVLRLVLHELTHTGEKSHKINATFTLCNLLHNAIIHSSGRQEKSQTASRVLTQGHATCTSHSQFGMVLKSKSLFHCIFKELNNTVFI